MWSRRLLGKSLKAREVVASFLSCVYIYTSSQLNILIGENIYGKVRLSARINVLVQMGF